MSRKESETENALTIAAVQQSAAASPRLTCPECGQVMINITVGDSMQSKGCYDVLAQCPECHSHYCDEVPCHAPIQYALDAIGAAWGVVTEARAVGRRAREDFQQRFLQLTGVCDVECDGLTADQLTLLKRMLRDWRIAPIHKPEHAVRKVYDKLTADFSDVRSDFTAAAAVVEMLELEAYAREAHILAYEKKINGLLEA